jgi:protease-4
MDPNSQPNPPQDPLAAVELVDRPPPPRPPKRRSLLGALFLVLLLLGLGFSLLLNVGLLFSGAGFDSQTKVQEKFVSHSRYARDKIAIMPVEGVILDEDEGFVKRQIDHVRKDKNVKAVVLRVDSPGGTVTGSDFLLHHLNKLREEREIPIVVSMGSVAASGGYYVSMAVGDTPETIFAEPTTWTGSIGVIIPHYDLSEFLQEKLGIDDDSISSHPLKNMGSFVKPMTEEERKIYQALVDESFARFKEIIKSGRPKFEEDSEALDELATGQVYTAEQGKELGLVDKIGFVEEAIQRAMELAGVDEEDVRVVKYRREPTLADLLIGARASRPGLDLASLLEMTAPRAYYLSTRMTPLVHSGN